MDSDSPIIVGGTVTHNPRTDDLMRVISCLKEVSDHVVVFDDGSRQEIVDAIKETGATLFHANKPEARALMLRRAALYHEAERLGADWFVYLDQDEDLSPTIRKSLRPLLTNLSHGKSKDSKIMSVRAVIVHYYKDLLHRTIGAYKQVEPQEWFAWRANMGFDYYGPLVELFTDLKEGEGNRAVHMARVPSGAQWRGVSLRFPYGAILHYANSTEERLKERLDREAKTGLINPINALGPEFIVDVPENPEWNDITKASLMWEPET